VRSRSVSSERTALHRPPNPSIGRLRKCSSQFNGTATLHQFAVVNRRMGEVWLRVVSLAATRLLAVPRVPMRVVQVRTKEGRTVLIRTRAREGRIRIAAHLRAKHLEARRAGLPRRDPAERTNVDRISAGPTNKDGVVFRVQAPQDSRLAAEALIRDQMHAIPRPTAAPAPSLTGGVRTVARFHREATDQQHPAKAGGNAFRRIPAADPQPIAGARKARAMAETQAGIEARRGNLRIPATATVATTVTRALAMVEAAGIVVRVQNRIEVQVRRAITVVAPRVPHST
jgi:hypothetical protein